VVLLDVQAILPAVELPVEMAQVVAGQVFAVSGELHGEADVGAAVQSLQETFDGRARDQLQVFERGEELRVDQFAGSSVNLHRSGTRPINRGMSASASIPSARAWKFKTKRWRSPGTATACTSAKSTWNWPRSPARALAPRIKYCAARGLPP